jgi:hypothetical protein
VAKSLGVTDGLSEPGLLLEHGDVGLQFDPGDVGLALQVEKVPEGVCVSCVEGSALSLGGSRILFRAGELLREGDDAVLRGGERPQGLGFSGRRTDGPGAAAAVLTSSSGLILQLALEPLRPASPEGGLVRKSVELRRRVWVEPAPRGGAPCKGASELTAFGLGISKAMLELTLNGLEGGSPILEGSARAAVSLGSGRWGRSGGTGESEHRPEGIEGMRGESVRAELRRDWRCVQWLLLRPRR